MVVAFVLGYYSTQFSRTLAPLADEDDLNGGLKEWLRPAFVQVHARRPISLDGQVIIRFCILGLKFCLFGSVMASILTPVYVASAGGQKSFLQFTASNLDYNLEGRHWKAWLFVGASYLFVFVFCQLMRWEWIEFIKLRHDHFRKKAQAMVASSSDTTGPDSQAAYSLIIENLPVQVKTDADLQRFFEHLFERGVHSCRLQRDLHELHNKKLLLEDHGCHCCCRCCPRMQRCYDRGIGRVVRLEREFARGLRSVQRALEQNTLDVEMPAASTGFVTFNSLVDRQIALNQVNLFRGEGNTTAWVRDWLVKPAPEAKDIVWRNVSIPQTLVQWRSLLFNILCIFGVIFWSTPLVLISSVTSPSVIKSHIPAVKWLEKTYPHLFSVVTGYLPLIAVNSAMLLLPYILEWFATNFEGRKKKSEIARKVLIRNFTFQLFTYYLLAIGASITESWEYFKLVAARPLCAFSVLGRTLPTVSSRFTIIVLNRLGVTLPFVVLRIQSFLSLCNIWADEPVYPWFPYEGTNLAIILIIANLYSVIAPVLMPLCALYFAVAACMYRWVFQNVYGRKLEESTGAVNDVGHCAISQEFDSGGKIWPPLYSCAMAGLLLGVISASGILSLQLVSSKQTVWNDLGPVYGMLALVPLILYFWWLCERTYLTSSDGMPFEDAVTVANFILSENIVSEFDKDYYCDPLLKLAADSSPTSSDDEDVSTFEDCDTSSNTAGEDTESADDLNAEVLAERKPASSLLC
eukprot:TRINITY_DN19665_c0_g1_i1.p1 TRINITY_DN19665_c0_g1~~TRINITY_DN19665_c0_g1_i1.p1  ORF type:complete len:824 (+),score=133.08 TRINITY_DN19665_c0_g1_i1:236-2473(+)